MNTTEIITKLRAQAAELTAMADALETASAVTIVLQAPWVAWEDLPRMVIAECTDGDFLFKGSDYAEWVATYVRTPDDGRWYGTARSSAAWLAPPHDRYRYRVVATEITGRETADDIRSIVERFKASQVPA